VPSKKNPERMRSQGERYNTQGQEAREQGARKKVED
jgi:hypothetical protein